jgi:hypothetical protein
VKAPRTTRESSAQALRSMSIDDAVTYAITEGAVNAQGDRIPIKHVADLMGMPLSVVYDIASQRRVSRSRELPLIARATSVILPIDAIEHQVGRVGVRLPVVSVDGDPSVSKAAAACREFGDLMERYGAYGMDRRWTAEEVADIRLQVEELTTAAMELVAQLESQIAPARPKAVGR